MLGKQWKDETDEVKAQYKAQAEELKRKHAEDYPDYQYTPRRPSEKKRRTTSRQYPRHARISRLGESPTFTPTASNPILRPGFQNTDITIAGHANEIGVGMGPLGGMDDGLGFSADALNALVQHVGATGTGTGAGTPTDGYMYQTGSGTTICPGPNGAEAAAAADSFEFSDFIADFY